jgi:hypothetical protein
MLRVLAAALLAALAPLAATAAVPSPAIAVAVLRPADGDRVLVEAAARLRLELGASGLPSALADGAADAFPDRVAFVREDGVATIDLVGTRPDASALHRRVRVPPTEGGDDPAVLALRAIELLRAMRIDVQQAPAAPPAIAVSAPAPAPPPASFVRVTGGVSLLQGELGGWPPAVGPTVSISVPVVGPVSAVLALAGPFFRDLATTPSGSAHTHEELGYLALRADTGPERWPLHVLVGFGGHHLRADYDTRGILPGGQPLPPDRRLSPDVWTPLALVQGGASHLLSRRVGVSLDVAALFLEPMLNVSVDDRSVGKAGGPSLMETLSLWIAFP